MPLVHATLTDVSVNNGEVITVQFNPTDYGIEWGASYAQMPVPGLQVAIQQFIRGESKTLSLELFLDASDIRGGTAGGTPPNTVKERLAKLRKFCEIQSATHSPPVCRFQWEDLVFTGVVTSLRERFVLFSERGQWLRARVSLTMREYKSAEVQLRELNLQSPDHTHVRVLREGETLSTVANEAYGDPRHWRTIAVANDIDRPRFIPPGTALKVPSQ
jgi:hypothetical protein